MKTILFSIIIIFSIDRLEGQCLSSKSAFIEYFDSQKLDPIEGIWSLNNESILYYKGQAYKETDVLRSEWAVIKIDRLTYKVCDIGEAASLENAKEFTAYFEKTAIDELYTYKCQFHNPSWIAKANVRLSEGVLLEYEYYIDDEIVKSTAGKNYKNGMKWKWKFLWTKKYPINNINKNNSSQYITQWTGNGSGFFIDKNGYIATNYHVIEDANEIEVDFIRDGKKNSFRCKEVMSDKQNDLSILKIIDPSFNSLTKLPFSYKSSMTEVGSNVFTLGYPLALSHMGEEVKFNDGKISSKTGFQGDVTTYQISVPLQPGNSGGPLFDFDGNLIGVVNAKIKSADNVSYAIKLGYLKNLIEVLPDQISIQIENNITSKTLTEKIKILSNYVVLIKVR